MSRFEEWRAGGTELRWRSTTAGNDGREVSVFARRCGTPGAPALVLVHGFPTSSVDFFALATELSGDFDIHVLDFPGYGLSDKPTQPYVYSLYDDARLLVHAITEVWNLTGYRMLTHDRGSSVGMIGVGLAAALDPPAAPVDLILTNGNIFLPLSNLTAFQAALLDPATGRATAAATTPQMLAAGMGVSTFMPRRTLGDPDIAAMAECFAPGTNRYWVVPGADHYVQCDAPGQLGQIVRLTARGGDIPLQTLGNAPDGAVLVDVSR